jgi:MFS family permease
VISTFALNYPVSFVRLADRRFHDTSLFAWLLTVVSIGSLLGSLLTARRRVVSLRYLLANAFVLGVSGITLSWAPNVPVALAVAIPLGIGGAGVVAATNSIGLQESPPEMRSRLLALIAVAFLGSTPSGAPITGWVGDHVSAEWSLAYGSVIALVCAVAVVVARSRNQTRSTAHLVGADPSIDQVVPS